ncbi:hypothetical protein B0T16DRAFT_393094 [Cercophora newfieldiana]|uniref:Uncharacterized protein n=1 Tax=Cercophora newfieldiana TaxID=92897 RepID=A0AA40CJG6_9PEZI|nr:hypothetical protein B0T16DRAFT_393094 [Cercophora newfieldiana]
MPASKSKTAQQVLSEQEGALQEPLTLSHLPYELAIRHVEALALIFRSPTTATGPHKRTYRDAGSEIDEAIFDLCALLYEDNTPFPEIQQSLQKAPETPKQANISSPGNKSRKRKAEPGGRNGGKKKKGGQQKGSPKAPPAARKPAPQDKSGPSGESSKVVTQNPSPKIKQEHSGQAFMPVAGWGY